MVHALLLTVALAAPTLDCSRHIETPTPSAQQRRTALRQSVTGHGVIFWGLRNAQRRTYGGGRGALGFKAALSVRAGAPMVVEVARRDRSWLALEYGDTRNDGGRLTVADGEPVMRFAPCDPDTPRFSDRRPIGRETAWAGGFIVVRPGCATLRVRREGTSRWHSLRAGFGRSCRT